MLGSREEMGQFLTTGRRKPPTRLRAESMKGFSMGGGGSVTDVTQGPVGPTLSTASGLHKRPEKRMGTSSPRSRTGENGLQGQGTSKGE